MPAPFDTDDLKKAKERLPGRIATAEEAGDFLAGEFWRDGKGWIGELPKDQATQTKIKDGLVTENVCAENIERHVGGVLGREPRWGMIERSTGRVQQPRLAPRSEDVPAPTQPRPTNLAGLIVEADDALTQWWDTRQPLATLQAAEARALAERRAPLRVYIPAGLRDEQGRIPRPKTLADAMQFIYLDTPSPEAAGVATDADTQRSAGLYSYTRATDGAGLPKGDYIELSYTNDAGATVFRILGSETDTKEAITYQLGGRLFVYDLKRPELLTPSVLQLQKALTLALTQGQRNVNMAGSRQQIALNAKQPGRWVLSTADDPEAQLFPEDGKYRRFEPGPMRLGAGVFGFVQGEDIRNDKGEIIGMANPNLSVIDPVSVTTFTDTRAMLREALYAQCQQTHALISGDATASGKSREQARAEFKSSLEKSKTALDDCLRWLLETVLYLAADLMGQAGRYAALRAEAGCIVDTGPLSPEEQAQIRENVKAGLTSEETAMAQLGHADVVAESSRIEKERKKRAENAPKVLTQPPVVTAPVEDANVQNS